MVPSTPFLPEIRIRAFSYNGSDPTEKPDPDPTLQLYRIRPFKKPDPDQGLHKYRIWISPVKLDQDPTLLKNLIRILHERLIATKNYSTSISKFLK